MASPSHPEPFLDIANVVPPFACPKRPAKTARPARAVESAPSPVSYVGHGKSTNGKKHTKTIVKQLLVEQTLA